MIHSRGEKQDGIKERAALQMLKEVETEEESRENTMEKGSAAEKHSFFSNMPTITADPGAQQAEKATI